MCCSSPALYALVDLSFVHFVASCRTSRIPSGHWQHWSTPIRWVDHAYRTWQTYKYLQIHFSHCEGFQAPPLPTIDRFWMLGFTNAIVFVASAFCCVHAFLGAFNFIDPPPCSCPMTNVVDNVEWAIWIIRVVPQYSVVITSIVYLVPWLGIAIVYDCAAMQFKNARMLCPAGVHAESCYRGDSEVVNSRRGQAVQPPTPGTVPLLHQTPSQPVVLQPSTIGNILLLAVFDTSAIPAFHRLNF